MKKATKRVIELKEKEAEVAKQTKWEVMTPCSLDEFRLIEVIADAWTLEGEDSIIFWKGENFEDGDEIAVFKEWIYAIKKPSL